MRKMAWNAQHSAWVGSALVVGVALVAIAPVACSSTPDTSGPSTTSSGELTGAGSSSSASSSSSSTGHPASSSSSSASSSSTSSSSGGGGGAGGMGAGGAGGGGNGGMPCVNSDPGEPNDGEASAYKLGSIDCADASGGSIYGVLASGGDEDWFVYTGLDKLNCSVDASSAILLGAGILRVCQYFECVSAVTEVNACPAGTFADVSPEGRDGCCGDGDFVVTALNCVGTLTEDIDVYVRVYDPSASAACLEYTIGYHY